MEPLLRGHPDERPTPLETCCVEAHQGGVGMQQQTRSRRQAQYSENVDFLWIWAAPILSRTLGLNQVDYFYTPSSLFLVTNRSDFKSANVIRSGNFS